MTCLDVLWVATRHLSHRQWDSIPLNTHPRFLLNRRMLCQTFVIRLSGPATPDVPDVLLVSEAWGRLPGPAIHSTFSLISGARTPGSGPGPDPDPGRHNNEGNTEVITIMGGRSMRSSFPWNQMVYLHLLLWGQPGFVSCCVALHDFGIVLDIHVVVMGCASAASNIFRRFLTALSRAYRSNDDVPVTSGHGGASTPIRQDLQKDLRLAGSRSPTF